MKPCSSRSRSNTRLALSRCLRWTPRSPSSQPSQPAIGDLGEPVQLRPLHGDRSPIAGRNRKRRHLPDAVARDVEMPRRLPLAHALRTSQTNLPTHVQGYDPRALPAVRGKSMGGRLLRRPQRPHPAATVADFLTAVLTPRGRSDHDPSAEAHVPPSWSGHRWSGHRGRWVAPAEQARSRYATPFRAVAHGSCDVPLRFTTRDPWRASDEQVERYRGRMPPRPWSGDHGGAQPRCV